MSKNFLLIVEGNVMEKNIFSKVFERYGFSVNDCGTLNIDDENCLDLEKFTGTDSKINIYIVQGPRTRIRDWLKLFNKRESDFDKLFEKIDTYFAGVFIIYDVDHTLKEELTDMFSKYQDETTGLLLLSSPCIEVVGDIERTEELKVEHLSEYKTQQNREHEQKHKKHTREYIIENFEKLVCFYLDKNVKESGDKNIMNHPEFVLKKINELNERNYISDDDIPVYYRYFTTVVYVCIAYIMGLTKEFENSDKVKSFFSSKIVKDE